MSLKLLKQSLDIVELPTTIKKEETVKKDHKNIKSKEAKGNLKITKKHTNFKQNDKKKTNILDIKNEMKLKTSKADENMKRLLALSQNTIKVADAEKIVKRAHKGRYVEVKLPKVEQESIFTEEDFRAFEEEYFKS